MVCVYFGHNNGVPKAHGLFNIFISYSNLSEKKKNMPTCIYDVDFILHLSPAV